MELGFKYDNLLMEESAQILEIETFIPMLLQVRECCCHTLLPCWFCLLAAAARGADVGLLPPLPPLPPPNLLQRAQDGHNRLKRVILIGDHHQLPPVVKNMAIQKYSHLDQSLFTRFIRLGTPYIELNAQVGGWAGGWGCVCGGGEGHSRPELRAGLQTRVRGGVVAAPCSSLLPTRRHPGPRSPHPGKALQLAVPQPGRPAQRVHRPRLYRGQPGLCARVSAH